MSKSLDMLDPEPCITYGMLADFAVSGLFFVRAMEKPKEVSGVDKSVLEHEAWDSFFGVPPHCALMGP